AVDGRRARVEAAETVAPLDAPSLDRGEAGRRCCRRVVGVAVEHAENAFAAAHEIADGAAILHRAAAAPSMKLDEIARQRAGARDVLRAEATLARDAAQIVRIGCTVGPLRDEVELTGVTERAFPRNPFKDTLEDLQRLWKDRRLLYGPGPALSHGVA